MIRDWLEKEDTFEDVFTKATWNIKELLIKMVVIVDLKEGDMSEYELNPEHPGWYVNPRYDTYLHAKKRVSTSIGMHYNQNYSFYKWSF